MPLTALEAAAIFKDTLRRIEMHKHRQERHDVALAGLRRLEALLYRGREVDILAQLVIDHRGDQS